MKKILSLLTATIMAFTMAMPVFGENSGAELGSGGNSGNVETIPVFVSENADGISGSIVDGNTISGKPADWNTISGNAISGNFGTISGAESGTVDASDSITTVDLDSETGTAPESSTEPAIATANTTEEGYWIPTGRGDTYYPDGSLQREVFYFDEETWYVQEYTYHSTNGEVRSWHYYSSDGTDYLMFYDTAGNVVPEDVGDGGSGGDGAIQHLPEYNENGKLIKETYISGTESEVYEYGYDELGRQNYTKFTYTDGEFSETSEQFLKYDIYSNITYEKQVYADGTWFVVEDWYDEETGELLLFEHVYDSTGAVNTTDYTDGGEVDPSTEYEVLSEDGKFGYDLYNDGTAAVKYIAHDKAEYFRDKTIEHTFEDGTVVSIPGYVWNRKTAEITIPETIDGHEVAYLSLSPSVSYDFVTKIYLPKTMYSVYINDGVMPNLAYAEMAEGGEYLTSIAGVIYRVGGGTIMFLPQNYEGTLILPPTYVGSGGESYNFDSYGKIHAFEIDNVGTEKPKYFTSDGMLFQYEYYSYNYDTGESILYENALVACPVNKTGVIRVPEGTTVIMDKAFSNSKASTIILPDGLKEIHYDAFYLAEASAVVIPESVTYIDDFETEELDDFSGQQKMYVKSGSYAEEYVNALTTNGQFAQSMNIINEFLEINPDAIDTIFQYEFDKKTYYDVLNGDVAEAIDLDNVQDGDLDGDGELGLVDVITLCKYVLGRGNLVDGMAAAADLSGDGVVNSVDVAILRYRVVH